MRDLYQETTDTIVASIEAGAGKWVMPWHSQGNGMPLNAATKAAYNGVNVLTLWATGAAKAYPTNVWASYRQWLTIGAQVRAGEKGSPIVYAGTATAKATETGGEDRKFSFLKTSAVFNAAQVEGYQAAAPVRPCLADRIASADTFIAATRADIRHGQGRAYYQPELDFVAMPDFGAFIATATATATENAYSTLLHELTHWTGHQTRCAREFGKRFGNAAYAAEELVAELGAAFLCAELGITPAPRADHAQYLAHWLQVLKADKKAIFTAAAAATKAAQYLRGLQPHALAIAA